VKKSESLGIDVEYEQNSKISKLPYYLTIQFVRFYWNVQSRIKAKILKPVNFPATLDLYELCTQEEKSRLDVNRQLMKERDEAKLNKNKITTTTSSDKTEEKEKEQENPDISQTTNAEGNIEYQNTTGFYDLVAVLSHKGRSADSGHYVAWIKSSKNKDEWLQYDDHIVTPVTFDEIRKLVGTGGADWHIAYLCMYASKTC